MRRSLSTNMHSASPSKKQDKLQTIADEELQNTRFTVFRKITNARMEIDQRRLPPKRHDVRNIDEEEQKFKLFSFKRKKIEKYSTPEIKLIQPLNAGSSLLSNGVKQDILFKSQKIQEMLSPAGADAFYKKNEDFTISRTSVMLKARYKKRQSIKDGSKNLFLSVIKPEECDEDKPIVVQDPPIKGPTVTSFPVPILPSVSQYNVFNRDIALFEREKIINLKSFIQRKAPFSTKVYAGRQKDPSLVSKNITKVEQLRLSEGEFTVVEYIEDSPIIQPLIGMVTTMTVLSVNREITGHNFDQRIPFATISPKGPQPFVAKIPEDQPVIAFINQVAASVVAPYEVQSETDFILCMGERFTLFRMPKTIYVSTKIESRVQVPFSKGPDALVDSFLESPPADPVELCINKAILLGTRNLWVKGIKHRYIVPQVKKKTVEQEIAKLPPDLRNGIYQYVSILKQTPWHRASNILKARLGIVSGQASLAVDKGNKAYLTDLLNTSFKNQIFMITTHEDEEVDDNGIYFDFDDLNFIEGDSEEEDWTEKLLDPFDDSGYTPSFGKGPGHTKMENLIDWKTLFPEEKRMRKVMLTAKYEIVDGVANCSVSYTRNPDVIQQIWMQEKSKKNPFFK